MKPEHLSVGGTSMQLQEHRLGTLPAPEACIVYSRISAMLLRVLDEERKGSSRNRQKLWLNICTALKKSDCDRIKKKKKNPKKRQNRIRQSKKPGIILQQAALCLSHSLAASCNLSFALLRLQPVACRIGVHALIHRCERIQTR